MIETLAEPQHQTTNVRQTASAADLAGRWQRVWQLPTVEARGPQWRDRTRRALAAGLERGDLPRHVAALAVWLLDRSGATGKPVRGFTQQQIADKLNASPRSVQRWLDELTARDWLARRHNQHRTSSGHIVQRPNDYLLTLPPWVQAAFDEAGQKRPRTRSPIDPPRLAPPDPTFGVDIAPAAAPPQYDPNLPAYVGLVQPDDPSLYQSDTLSAALLRSIAERSPP